MRTPLSWDEAFLRICRDIAERSKDPSTQCGAVVVDRVNRVLGVGFNGPPPQIEDGLVPWDRRPDKYAYIIHAEENAILTALDGHGSRELLGGVLYVNGHPCSGCVVRAIRAGLSEIRYTEDAVPRCVDLRDRETTAGIIARQKGYGLRLVRLGDPVPCGELLAPGLGGAE